MRYKLIIIFVLSVLLLTGCSKKENSIVEPSQPSVPIPNLMGTWSGSFPLPPHPISQPIVIHITYQSNDTVKGYGVIGDSLEHANEHLQYTSFTHIGIIQNDSLIDYLYPAESSNPQFYEAQIADSSLHGYLWLKDVRGDMAGIASITLNQ